MDQKHHPLVIIGTILLVSLLGFSNVFAETVNTKETSITPAGDIDIEAQVVNLVGGPKGFMETFRKKQAVYFTTLRDTTKEKIGIKDTSSLSDAPPAPLPFTDSETMGDLPQYKQDSPWDYVILIFATAMATVFSEILLFYISLVILTFFIIRFFFRMFV